MEPRSRDAGWVAQGGSIACWHNRYGSHRTGAVEAASGKGVVANGEDSGVTLDPLDFIRPALRWERRSQKGQKVLVPNVTDTGSTASVAIASALYRALGVAEVEAAGTLDAGGLLEEGIAEYLRTALPLLD